MAKKSFDETIVWASGFYMTKELPGDWGKMGNNELITYIKDHALDAYDSYGAFRLWSDIQTLARSSKAFYNKVS